jgi:hypothetical protein
VAGEGLAVHHGRTDAGDAFGRGLDVGDGFGEDLADALFREAEFLDEFVGAFCRRRGFGEADAGAGLGDGAMEKALGAIGGHERAGFEAAAGFAEDEDLAGIAAEGRDVVAHPFERGDHVEHAGDAAIRELFAVGGKVEVAEEVEAVVDGDDDNVTAFCEAHAVIGVGRA